MKIEIIKNKLQSALIQVERLTTKNSSLPILNNVLFVVNKNKLIIKATNLEIGIEVTLPLKSDTDFSFAINPMVLNQTLQNINEDKIFIEKNNDNFITIETSKGSVNLNIISPEDFPIIPRLETDIKYSISSKDFTKGIKSVLYAAALSDIKPEISSVYIFQEDSTLFFVATDSFRLSEKKISLKETDLVIPKIILPLKNAVEIVRVLQDQEDVLLEVFVNSNQISINTTNLYLTSRVIDGVYPDYRQIMPKNFLTTVEVDRNELITTLKLINTVADKFNRLNILINPDGIVLTTKNTEIGESELVIRPKNYTGEPASFTVNSRNILETFQSFNDDYVFLGCNESVKPLCIKGLTDNSFRALIMPLRS